MRYVMVAVPELVQMARQWSERTCALGYAERQINELQAELAYKAKQVSDRGAMIEQQAKTIDQKCDDLVKVNQLLASRSKELEAAKRVMRESGCTALTEELGRVRKLNEDLDRQLTKRVEERDDAQAALKKLKDLLDEFIKR